jgi:hypothetical protein
MGGACATPCMGVGQHSALHGGRYVQLSCPLSAPPGVKREVKRLQVASGREGGGRGRGAWRSVAPSRGLIPEEEAEENLIGWWGWGWG